MPIINENSDDTSLAGVLGSNTAGGPGVWGSSDRGRGVVGVTVDGVGVWGHTTKGRAVVGAVNDEGTGVWGETKTGRAIVGVVNGDKGTGVWGEVKTGTGVVGVVNEGGGAGVAGRNDSGDGVSGTGRNGVAAFGNHTGVYAKAPVNAGFFEGNIHVTGNITTAGDILLHNADCAEDFDVTEDESIEPGTVMVLGEEGVLQQSHHAYDKRVAGVVSGAGDCKPGIVLGKQQSQSVRQPIALLGTVFCKADAGYASIDAGDLLTTSPTPGHAMKADDPVRAFGAVIGKALRPLNKGQSLIPILIALQ